MKQYKKITAAILCAAAIFGSAQFLPVQAEVVTTAQPAVVTTLQPAALDSLVYRVNSQRWTPTVRQGLNEFLATYGNQSGQYDASVRPYAVFDFDNTTSILDVMEQCEIWQLDHLAFAIKPDQMKNVLLTGIPADKLTATYGADDGDGRPVRIIDAIDDATAAYASLYKAGLVKTEGSVLDDSVKDRADYKTFVTSMRWLYDAIGDTMDASVSYPWVTYWFTGMTPDQVYKLAYACDSYYGNPFTGQTWTKGKYTSPDAGKAGALTVGYKLGITVTPEIRELYGALDKNGIDTWVCSASPIDVIRAAVDYFKVPGVDGIVAMTNKLDKDGKYINEYDYDLHDQTQGVGKSNSISKVIVPKYNGHGPTFAAMDSQGDFNFCTEYKDTKEVLILNRQRKDDAALCAAVAVYQQENGTGLAAANAAGDTLYLLQGRNENKGELWDNDKVQLLGKDKDSFLSPKAEKALQQLKDGKSVKDVMKDNTKLKDYQGYKTR